MSGSDNATEKIKQNDVVESGGYYRVLFEWRALASKCPRFLSN